MPIDPIPAPPGALDDPNFVALIAAFFGALPTLRSQINSTTLAYGPGAPWCTAAGTANAITLTTGLSLATLVAGQSFSWVATADNTAAVTINPDGLGATATKRPEGGALPAGWIKTGEIMGATYDGTSVVVYPSASYLAAQTAVTSLFDEAVASTAAHDRVFGTAYRSIEIDIHNLVPAVAGATLRMRLGNGSGVMETGATDYEYSFNGGAAVAANVLPLSDGISASSGIGYSGTIKIFGAQAAGTWTRVRATGTVEPTSGGGIVEARLNGARTTTVQNQSFSLFMTSGNFTAERVTVRGVK